MVCFEATIHVWSLQKFISGLWIVDTNAKPLRDYGDNFAAIFFWKDDKYWKGAKHIKLEYLFIKEEVQKHSVIWAYKKGYNDSGSAN